EGGATLVSTPVSYDVNMVNGDSITPLPVAANEFVKRSFVINGTVDTNTAGALYLENGKVNSVPATFTANKDGTTTVTIARPGFSTYVVATHNVTFTDIDASWAASRIQSLANKFLVYGTTTTTYSPKQNVTRAEFASMLVRALGLQTTNAAPFADVTANDWFAHDVAAAYEAGLVSGIGNDMFDPSANISRQDLTIMLAKAIHLLNITPQNGETHHAYADAAQFGAYAIGSINTVTASGLMAGVEENGTYSFHPHDPTTREAAASVLYFLLQQGHLIN
ncbi:MAG: S-layer homology domain-containing protein, partial [Tumebacillaceae bacterium]